MPCIRVLCYHFVFPLLYQRAGGGESRTAPQFECGHGLYNCNNKKPSNGISSIKRSISNNMEGTQPHEVRQIYSSWQPSTGVACLYILISCMSVARTDRLIVCLPSCVCVYTHFCCHNDYWISLQIYMHTQVFVSVYFLVYIHFHNVAPISTKLSVRIEILPGEVWDI